MAKPNTTFKLSIRDVEIIEHALRAKAGRRGLAIAQGETSPQLREEMNEIQEVAVYGEKNPIIGNIVCCNILLSEAIEINELKKRIRNHCIKKIESYKIPIKINIVKEQQHSERFKKMRK